MQSEVKFSNKYFVAIVEGIAKFWSLLGCTTTRPYYSTSKLLGHALENFIPGSGVSKLYFFFISTEAVEPSNSAAKPTVLLSVHDCRKRLTIEAIRSCKASCWKKGNCVLPWQQQF